MGAVTCVTLLFYFDRLTYTTNSVFASIYIGIATITLSVNLLLIAAMVRTKQAFSNTSSTLIICVSAVDSLSGALSLPLYSSVRFTYKKLRNCTLASTGQLAGIFLAHLSFSIVILMAIDRYLHMRTSLNAKRSILMKLFTGKWIILPLVTATMVSMLASVSYLITNDLENVGGMTTFVFVNIAKLGLVPGIAILYIIGYNRVRKFVRKNPVYNQPASGTRIGNEPVTTAEPKGRPIIPGYLRNLQKTVLMLIVALLFTYIPFTVADVVLMRYFLSNKQTNAIVMFYDIANILFLSGFTLNSLIIFKMNRKARTWVTQKIFCGAASQ